MYRRRLLYRPSAAAYLRGYSAAMAHTRRDLARLREDWLLEAEMIREEVRAAKAELRRLQQLDQAQYAERDFGMLLQ